MKLSCEYCESLIHEIDEVWNKLDTKIATLYDNQKFIMEVLEEFKSRENGFDISSITRH